MNINALTDLDRERVETKTDGYSLILLSPRFRNRNVLMSWFLESGRHILFYSLRPEDTNLITLLHNLIADLQSDSDPKFGSLLTKTLAKHDATLDELADALNSDLSKAKPKAQYLILDNLDFLITDESVYKFFYHLVEGLPSGIQLVINSRELNFKPWDALIRRNVAVMLGDDKTLDEGIYNPKIVENSHLEVYGFGGGAVHVNGVKLENWDGPLPRNLFYYFIDHPMVTRDEIFATFWPDLPAKEATNVFHVTKRKVSERLGYELTAYSGGFYRPSGQMSVHYDIARFEEAIEEANRQEPESPEIWYRAIQLYRSPFLYGISMPWIEDRREKLRLTYAQALIGVGRLYKANDDSERAISYFLRALHEVPQREDIHRDIMSLYEARGDRDKAVAQYKWLADVLKRTLNITPSKTTRALYEVITAKN